MALTVLLGSLPTSEYLTPYPLVTLAYLTQAAAKLGGPPAVAGGVGAYMQSEVRPAPPGKALLSFFMAPCMWPGIRYISAIRKDIS